MFEKAEAYLNLHLTHTGPGAAITPTGPFVTISRESGTGGSSLARALAERLPQPADTHPWEIYGANVIETMLQTNHLPARLARFLPEDSVSEVDASIGEIVGLHPNLWQLIERTNELIRQLARGGHAILLGRGANFATRGISHGIHVRLVAPRAWRAERTARWLSLSPEIAALQNERRDAARARYVRSTFDADVGAPAAYDLVINVAAVTLDSAVDIIAGFVRAHQRSTLDVTRDRVRETAELNT